MRNILSLAIAVSTLFFGFINELPASEKNSCHSSTIKQTVFHGLFESIGERYGEDTMRDLFSRTNPELDRILIANIDSDISRTVCSARLTLSISDIDFETVMNNSTNEAVNTAVLLSMGIPTTEQASTIRPTKMTDDHVYWDDFYYTTQPTSDGRNIIVTVMQAAGYSGWLNSIVQYGGLSVRAEEAQLAADREAGRAELEANTTQLVKTPTPSFDCHKASSHNEKLICTDYELAELDRKMSDIYNEAKSNASSPKVLQEQARQAWRWREDNCHDKECLAQWYTNRIKALLK